MNRYDNFNPEIIEYEEQTSSVQEAEMPTAEEIANEKKRKATTVGSRVVKRAKKPKSQPKTARKREATTERQASSSSTTMADISSTVKEWANGTTLRMLLGIFLGCFAAYMIVAFISYFATCIADQSEINHLPLGAAKTIHNAAGEGGARLSNFLINDTFGLGSIVIVIWLTAMSLKQLAGYPRFKSVNFTIKCLVALITVSLIVGLATIAVNTPVNWGGYHGLHVNEFIISFFGWTGAAILCFFMVAAFVVICMRDFINWILRKRKERAEKRAAVDAEREAERLRQKQMEADRLHEENDARAAGEAPEVEQHEEGDAYVSFANHGNTIPDEQPEDFDTYVYEEEGPAESTASLDCGPTEGRTEDAAEEDESDPMVINRNTIDQSGDKRLQTGKNEGPKYKLPPFDILRPGIEKIAIDPVEQQYNKDLIRQTLLDFKIPIQSIEATVGPTVTLYEIVPGTGVKISRICSLVDDIALNLSAIGVRIIAPIPGRGTVGIEVANKERQTVAMRTVLQSRKFAECNYRLPIALGATISNDVYIADLAKMPHLLVAGATGQGKSVCLNAIIASLLYRKRPDELKFVMIDPKMVEFSLYNKIDSHYLAKLPDAEEAIITKMDNVIPTLSSLCVEMDSRYELLKGAQCRNLEEYNTKIQANKLNPNDGHRFLPYIVIVVDEFGDLIMTAGKEVEIPIARLAQKARAVGMHVILATQRPSVKVITGIIKANFPARFAFKTTSGVDSKTILDTVGAEQLIGMGDMLVSNNSDLVRVQCAFIDTPEVEELCDYVQRQPFNAGCYLLPEPIIQGESETGGLGGGDDYGALDPLLPEAARAMINSNVASTSSLQRRFSIGYNRAGKIMDQLEQLGVVGPAHGGKPRSILVDPNSLETILLSL